MMKRGNRSRISLADLSLETRDVRRLCFILEQNTHSVFCYSIKPLARIHRQSVAPQAPIVDLGYQPLDLQYCHSPLTDLCGSMCLLRSIIVDTE